MQLALNVVIFFLGFSLAALASTRPKKTRRDIDYFLDKLRYVLDSLRPGAFSISSFRRLEEAESYHSFGSEEEEGIGKALYTRHEVEQTFPGLSWQREAYNALTSIIQPSGPNHKVFPCVYATKGFRANEHRYVFLESDDPSEPRNVRLVARALHAYLPQSKSIGKNTSLLCVCPPSQASRSLDYYNHSFWELLRGLRIADPKPWPSDIPKSTASSKWAFCYDSIPVFPVAMTPLYKKRHSRWAPNVIYAFQPKWVFDELLGTDARRKSATTMVRKLLEKYDDVEISPDLTAYGSDGTSEVHQLFLRDDNDESLDCPFSDFDTAMS